MLSLVKPITQSKLKLEDFLSPSRASFPAREKMRILLFGPPNRLTKLQNSRQLLPITPLSHLTFERYHSIIVLDSNRNPCYPVTCFPRIPSNHPPLRRIFLPSARSASLGLTPFLPAPSLGFRFSTLSVAFVVAGLQTRASLRPHTTPTLHSPSISPLFAALTENTGGWGYKFSTQESLLPSEAVIFTSLLHYFFTSLSLPFHTPTPATPIPSCAYFTVLCIPTFFNFPLPPPLTSTVPCPLPIWKQAPAPAVIQPSGPVCPGGA
jgi:hypothetical protein